MGETRVPADDFGLAAALAAHPEARVTAITPEGQFCEMPPDLRLGHEVIEAASIFEICPQSEWASIGAGWMRVLQYGSYVGACVLNGGERVSTLTFDARERYGVVVMLMIPGATLGEASTDRQKPIVSRFGVYHRDAIATVIGADEGAEGLLGWSVAELGDIAANDLIHPDDQANGLENWLTTLAAPVDRPQRWRGRHLHRDGTYRWIEFTNTNRMADLGHVVSEMMDISEEMAASEALSEQQELLARLNDALPLGVCQIDRERNVVYANNQLYELVGARPGSPSVLHEALDDVDEADRPVLTAAVDAVLADGSDQAVEVTVHRAGAGDLFFLIILRALRDTAGAITGAILCISDITEATYLGRELEHRATFDQLTGCHNRATTMAELRRALIFCRTGEARAGTAAIFIDLDRFKPVNDRLGHAAGDELLVAIADRLRANVREHDVVGRIGGDEFLVVCPELPAADMATAMARRIAADLVEPFTLDAGTVRIGASVGVAWTDAPGATPDALVAAADAAMYRSKQDGRSQAVLA